jgi:tight adherence protein C
VVVAANDPHSVYSLGAIQMRLSSVDDSVWVQSILLGLTGVAVFTLVQALSKARKTAVTPSLWRQRTERLIRFSVRQRYERWLRHANMSRWAVVELWALRWLATGLGGVVCCLISLSWPMLLLGCALGWLTVGAWVRQRAQSYQNELVAQLPAFLDLLSLCLSAGMNLQTGVQTVVQHQSPSALNALFQTWLWHVRSGKSRIDAFDALLQSVKAAPLRRVCVALIQAEQAGSGMAACLNAHSAQLRQAQLMQAERQALQAPVKMLLPLVVCFFPSTFLVLGFSILINLGEYLD